MYEGVPVIAVKYSKLTRSTERLISISAGGFLALPNVQAGPNWGT